MRKITPALSAACLLFSLNSAVVARAFCPDAKHTGTTAAILAEQAPIHWVSGGPNRKQSDRPRANGRGF